MQHILDAAGIITSPSGWAPLQAVIGVAIHHTVTTISPFASEDEERRHIAAIDAYHVSKGWYGIGYHYLVFPSGRIYRTGTGARAHVANRNHELVGIAFVADLSSRTPSPVETAAAAAATADAWHRFTASNPVPVRGHRDWVVDPAWATSCPGNATAVIHEITARAHDILQKDTDAAMTTLDEILRRLERLERIVCTNGNTLSVTADADNAPTLARFAGKPVAIGETVTITGDAIPAFLDEMGNNLYLGLQTLQRKTAAPQTISITLNSDGTASWTSAH